jgi:hypothetical protein
MRGGRTDRTVDPRRPTVTDSTDVTSETDPSLPTGVVVAFPARRPTVPASPDGGAFTVDCAECTHRHSHVCDDCVVSFIVGREPEDALVVDAAEARAVRLLEQAGLVPGVRHQSRASGQ